MLKRNARRVACLAAASAIAVASGSVIASTSGWGTSAEFLTGTLTSTVVDGDAVVLASDGVGRADAAPRGGIRHGVKAAAWSSPTTSRRR